MQNSNKEQFGKMQAVALQPLKLHDGSDIPSAEQTSQLNQQQIDSMDEHTEKKVQNRSLEHRNAIFVSRQQNEKSDSISVANRHGNNVNTNNNGCELPEQNIENNNSAMDVAKQLEKWNKVRESLYSQHGWSSENVNQNSKWDIDVNNAGEWNKSDGMLISDTGTNIWSNDGKSCHNAFSTASGTDGNNFPSEGRNKDGSGFNKYDVDSLHHHGGAIPKRPHQSNRYNLESHAVPSNSPTFETTPAIDLNVFNGTNIGKHADRSSSQMMFTDNRDATGEKLRQWQPPSHSNQYPFTRAITKKTFQNPPSLQIDTMPAPQYITESNNNNLPFHFQNLNLSDSFNSAALTRNDPTYPTSFQLFPKNLAAHEHSQTQHLHTQQQTNYDARTRSLTTRQSHIYDQMQGQQSGFFNNPSISMTHPSALDLDATFTNSIFHSTNAADDWQVPSDWASETNQNLSFYQQYY